MSFPSNPTDQQRATVNNVVYVWNAAKTAWQRTAETEQGIDAATLDGLNSSQFLRNDQSQTLTGNFSTSGTITASTGIIASGNSIAEQLEITGDLTLDGEVMIADTVRISTDGITSVNTGQNLVLKSLGSDLIEIDGTLSFDPALDVSTGAYFMKPVGDLQLEQENFNREVLEDVTIVIGDSANDNVALVEYQSLTNATISGFPYQNTITRLDTSTLNWSAFTISQTFSVSFGTGLGISGGFATYVNDLGIPNTSYYRMSSFNISLGGGTGGLRYIPSLNFSNGGSIVFYAIHGSGSNGGYQVGVGEELLVQLSLNASVWTTIYTVPTFTPAWTKFTVAVPAPFDDQNTVYLRFWSIGVDSSTDAWKGIDLIYVVTPNSVPEGQSNKYLALRTADTATEASIITNLYNFKEIRQFSFQYITADYFIGGTAPAENSLIVEYGSDDSTAFQTLRELPNVSDWTSVDLEIFGSGLDRDSTRLRFRNSTTSGTGKIGIRRLQIQRYPFISRLKGKLEAEYLSANIAVSLSELTVDDSTGLTLDIPAYSGSAPALLSINPVTGSLVTYDGEETLTNKTLTEPVIDTAEINNPVITDPVLNYSTVLNTATTGTLVVDASSTSYVIREASFGGNIGVDISNLTTGRSVFIYARNTNASARILTIRADIATTYAAVILANRGTAAITTGAITLAASGGAVGVWVFNAGGTIRGSF
jgi:hypothetical protein